MSRTTHLAVVALAITICLALVGIFFGLAGFFLADAQKWIANRERTRHWKEESGRRRRSQLDDWEDRPGRDRRPRRVVARDR